MRSICKLFVSAFVAGCMLVMPLRGYAAIDSFTVHRLPNGATQVQPSLISTFRNAGFDLVRSGRGTNIGLSGAVSVGQSAATMRLGYALDAAKVATLAAKALPAVATGLAVYEVARMVRCYAAPNAHAFDGFLECDPGQSPTPGGTVTAWNRTGCAGASIHGCSTWAGPFATAEEACTSGVTTDAAQPGRSGMHYVNHSPPSGTAPNRTISCAYRDYYNSDPTCQQSCGMATVYVSEGTMPGPGSCPSWTDSGGQVHPGGAIGPDGKCDSGARVPASVQDVATKLGTVPDANWDPDAIVRDAIEHGGDPAAQWVVDNGPVGLTGPASVNGPTSTHTPPGGSPQTTTTVYNITYEGDTFNYSTTTVDDTGTTTTDEKPQEVCGLPGKPACKIDETGTPTKGDFTASQSALDAAADAIVGKITDATTPKAIPWLWGGIALPAGACSDMTVASPWPTIPDATLNICNQPWVAWWRSAWAWIAGALTMWYVYGRFTRSVNREV